MINPLKVNGQTDVIKLTGAILFTLAVGFTSSLFTINAIEIYKNLAQPAFAPPGWVFGPVWTILYILMGLAAYRVWMYGWEKRKVRSALIFYLVQLGFNFSWSLLFFWLELRGIALIEIIALWVLIVITMLQFRKIDITAFYLLVPYILWVSFATVLNYSVWMLNR